MRFSGTVQEGSKYAATLGFPTINIPYEDTIVSGIYAGLVHYKKQAYPGAIYADVRRKVLEAHIFNFSESLYGQEVSIELLQKIREDRPFTEGEAQKAIAEDVRKAQEYFSV